MSICYLLHQFHCKLVVVGCNIGSGEYRCHFMLGRSNFVVLGLSKNTMFPQFFVKILHK